MTKAVRIENADTSDWIVVVQEWEKHLEGDKLVRTVELNHPTKMSESYIHSGKYLIITERAK